MDPLQQGHSIDHVTASGSLITLFSAPDYPQFKQIQKLGRGRGRGQGAGKPRTANKTMGAYATLIAPKFDKPEFCPLHAAPRPGAICYCKC